MDWHNVWRRANSLSHGLQGQNGYYHWHRSGFDIFMAVSEREFLMIHDINNLFGSRGTSFTYFDDSADGDARFEFFKKVVSFHPIKSTLGVQDWNVSGAGGNFALALFTLLYVDIIDCTATLYSMARFSGVVDPETDDFPRSTVAYCTDAISISIGSLLGVSPVTAFIESGAGITEGGRTGLTAITTGICFLISIFFAPIFASIPPWATGCTLVLVRKPYLCATSVTKVFQRSAA